MLHLQPIYRYMPLQYKKCSFLKNSFQPISYLCRSPIKVHHTAPIYIAKQESVLYSDIHNKIRYMSSVSNSTIDASPKRSIYCFVLFICGCTIGLIVYDLITNKYNDDTLWDFEWDTEWLENAEESSGRKRVSNATDEHSRTFTRQILLVRHGQYENVNSQEDDEQGLTALGKKQAEITGHRLRELLKGKKIVALYHSDLKRAQETAQSIAEVLGEVPVIQDSNIAEGVPTFPSPPSRTFKPTQEQIDVDGPRIEKAFQNYFYRALPPHQKADDQTPVNEEYEILVCHGNVIRYFFCRALQLSPSAWLRLATYNCGITWLSISTQGYVSARQFGDVGHMEPSMVTYT